MIAHQKIKKKEFSKMQATKIKTVWRIYVTKGTEETYKEFRSGSRALKFRDDQERAGLSTFMHGIPYEQSDISRAQKSPLTVAAAV
jgi:hypothetical protein